MEYRRGSVGPDRLPLVPVVSILSYSVEYEIGILSLLDKESSIEPGDLMISCVFLELHFFTFFSTLFFGFLVTRMIFHLNPHTFNLNSFPLAEGTSLPVHFSTTGSSMVFESCSCSAPNCI